MTEKDKEFAALCLEQPFLLAKHFLGPNFKDLDEAVHGRAFHFLMGREIPKGILHPKAYYRHKRGNLKRMLMRPRFSWKTTMVMGVMVAQIIRNRTKTNKISMATVDMSVQTVTAVRDLLERPQIVDTYGTFRNPEKWAKGAFTVLGGTTGARDFTLDAAGVDKGVASAHCDGILALDDLLNELTAPSIVEREKAINHVRALQPVTSHDCVWLHTCTPWHEDDVAHYCMTMGDQWDILIEPAMYPDYEDRVTGKIHPVEYPFEMCPKLTRVELPKHEIAMGPAMYAAQFLCDPYQRKDAVMKPEWFIGVPMSEVPRRLNIGVCIDPADPEEAVHRKLGKSLTGIAAVGMDENGVGWIFQGEHGDYPDFRNFLEAIIEAHDIHVGRKAELNLSEAAAGEFDPLERLMLGVWFEQGLLKGRVGQMLRSVLVTTGHGNVAKLIRPYSADSHKSKIGRMHNLAAMFRMDKVKVVRTGRVAHLGEEARSINLDKYPIMDAMDAAAKLLEVLPIPSKIVTEDKDLLLGWTPRRIEKERRAALMNVRKIGVGGVRGYLGDAL